MRAMGLNILWLENNPVTADLLRPALKRNEHVLTVIDTPRRVMPRIRAAWPDLLVMNVFSYGSEGPSTYQSLRSRLEGLPAILLVPDAARWLGQQAYEFVTPPFTARKLLHRLRKLDAARPVCEVKKDDLTVVAVAFPLGALDTWLGGATRLSSLPLEAKAPPLRAGHVRVVDVLRQGRVTLSLRSNTLWMDQTEHHLRPKEAQLLTVFMCHAREVVSRKKLMQLVWKTDFTDDTRTLNVHIRWLREKIEDDPGRPVHLRTVRGVGYRFEAPPHP
jgi:DNA-binding response OmpR family regulator